MHTVALKEAEGRLAALLDEVAKGQEVVITREDGATFKIVSAAPLLLIPNSAVRKVSYTSQRTLTSRWKIFRRMRRESGSRYAYLSLVY